MTGPMDAPPTGDGDGDGAVRTGMRAVLRRRPGERKREWVRRVVWSWVGIAAFGGAAAALFGKVAGEVLERETGRFDEAVRAVALSLRTPVGFAFFEWVAWVGSPVGVLVVAVAAGALLWMRGGRWISAAVVLAPAAATAAFVGIKHLIERPRPAGALLLDHLTYSFPSGHATTAAAVFLTVAYVLAREVLIGRPLALLVAIAGPLLIGASRVYLDAHYATDVIGGWALGAVIAVLAGLLYERLRIDVRATELREARARRRGRWRSS